jgi:ATP-dependent helicase YprA (DUF1998 family)
VNPDSVRRIKHDLLRARATHLANADAEVREKAEAALFEAKSAGGTDQN